MKTLLAGCKATLLRITSLLVVLCCLSPALSFATTLKEAVDNAAEYFVKEAVRIDPGMELHVLQVVNFSSGENDIDGKKIETEIYFALERQLPDFKLFLGKGPNKEKEIYLSGTYEKRGDITIVKFQVFKEKEILAQKEVEFDSKVYRKTLVAVLDLEATMLNGEQRKIFSDIFRSALNDIGEFDLASSADIDKMNPDAIQQASGCTRDTCATIIGEQLGVDRVISSSLRKVDENYYFLAGKMIDIKDGSLLVSKTVEHSGSLRTLKDALQELAEEISGKVATVSIPESDQQFPEEEIEKDDGWPWWVWATGVALLLGVAAAASGGGEDSGSSSSPGNGSTESCPSGSGNCGSVTVTW